MQHNDGVENLSVFVSAILIFFWFFFVHPYLKQSQLCEFKDGTKFWWLPWFPAKSSEMIAIVGHCTTVVNNNVKVAQLLPQISRLFCQKGWSNYFMYWFELFLGLKIHTVKSRVSTRVTN